MATVNKKQVLTLRQFGGVPYGNKWSDRFTLETNASGVFVDSDQATALIVADKVRLGVLPAGVELHDILTIISDAFTAATTLGLGFEYVDGVDSTAVPQDAAYFIAAGGLVTSATGITRKTTVTKPVTLPKAAYLIATIAGATHASVGVVDFVVDGINHGNP
jgi:hypothetical protein